MTWVLGSNTFNIKGWTEHVYDDIRYPNKNMVDSEISAHLKLAVPSFIIPPF